ncbi:hypothetical protein Pcac1_g25710 [Phytophthora cactorum]|nr:hypothetical protein Pcac1_g25710 [Phytophthora cactorum]
MERSAWLKHEWHGSRGRAEIHSAPGISPLAARASADDGLR